MNDYTAGKIDHVIIHIIQEIPYIYVLGWPTNLIYTYISLLKGNYICICFSQQKS